MTPASAGYDELLGRAMLGYYRETLGLPERKVRESMRTRRAMSRGRNVASLLDRELGLSGKRMLDAGSGWGELVYMCRQAGATAFGVEPHGESVRVASALARERADASWFVRGLGEALPHPADTFDIVVSHHVLEHVPSSEALIRELLRVTRPGGHVLLAFPNYAFPFEGHYRIPWVPLLPKRLGAWVLRALGRDPRYLLGSVHYVTYRGVRRLVERMPVTVRSLSEERRARDRVAQRGLRGLAAEAQRRLGLYPTGTLLLRKAP